MTQPVPAIEKVGARGLVEIKWNQNMRKPRSFEEIEQGTVMWKGEHGSIDEKPILDVQIVPGSFSNPEDTNYSWNITKWEDKELNLQIWFKYPDKISTNEDPEKIQVIFYGIEYFVSEDFQVPVNGGPDKK